MRFTFEPLILGNKTLLDWSNSESYSYNILVLTITYLKYLNYFVDLKKIDEGIQKRFSVS